MIEKFFFTKFCLRKKTEDKILNRLGCGSHLTCLAYVRSIVQTSLPSVDLGKEGHSVDLGKER